VDLDALLQRVYAFVSIRPRSEWEMKSWLKRKKVDPSTQELIIEKLHTLSLLNDLDFAKWWIEQRNTFRPKGAAFLKHELRKKGVPVSIISQAVAETPIDEEVLARTLVEKKIRTLSRYPSDVQSQKLFDYLSRRGFSLSIIRRVIDVGDLE
jgi:regulatory protein